MSVTQTITKVIYAGDGVADEFSFPFKAFLDRDVSVSLIEVATRVITPQAAGVDFTVVRAAEGGTVTFIDPPALGFKVLIKRSQELIQDLDLTSTDVLRLQQLEDKLDMLTMMIQEQATEIARAGKIPEDSALIIKFPFEVVNGDFLVFSGTNGDVIGQPYVVDLSEYSTTVETQALIDALGLTLTNAYEAYADAEDINTLAAAINYTDIQIAGIAALGVLSVAGKTGVVTVEPRDLDPTGAILGQVIGFDGAEWTPTTNPAGVTDHSLLSGLGADDHPQYHNDARGDARYYTETELNAGQLDNRYFTEAETTAAIGAASTTDRDRANHTGTQALSTLSQSSATTNQVPKWNGSAWTAQNLVPASGLLFPENTSGTPTAPTFPNSLNIIPTPEIISGKDYILPLITNDYGSFELETSHFRKRLYKVEALAGGTTFVVGGGWGTFTATGTATASALNTTNNQGTLPRVEAAVTTAAVGAVAGFRAAQLTLRRGAGSVHYPNAGGFRVKMLFGIGRGIAANSTRRLFAGLAGTTAAPTNVEPSTIANILGVGADTADTNWHIMTRAGGTVSRIDTGVPKAVSNDNEAVFELEIFSATNNGSPSNVEFKFKDVTNGFSLFPDFTHQESTNLPDVTTYLGPRVWGSTAATNSTIGIMLMEVIADSYYYRP